MHFHVCVCVCLGKLTFTPLPIAMVALWTGTTAERAWCVAAPHPRKTWLWGTFIYILSARMTWETQTHSLQGTHIRGTALEGKKVWMHCLIPVIISDIYLSSNGVYGIYCTCHPSRTNTGERVGSIYTEGQSTGVGLTVVYIHLTSVPLKAVRADTQVLPTARGEVNIRNTGSSIQTVTREHRDLRDAHRRKETEVVSYIFCWH